MNLTYVVAVVIVVFGAIGFQRGWLREVGTLASLLLAWFILIALGDTLVGLVNRLQLMVEFTLRGGFDASAPGALLQEIRHHPLLDSRHPDGFLGVLFVVLAALAYLGALRFAPAAASASARILGALIGLVNGYLVTYLCLRYLAPTTLAITAIPWNPGGVVDLLGRYLPTLLVVGVLLAIGIALISSKRLGGRGSPRPAPSRAKG